MGPPTRRPSTGKAPTDRAPTTGKAASTGRAASTGKAPTAGQARQGRPGRPATADAARSVAYTVIRAVDTDDAYANLVLPRLLTERRVHGRDAALATELTYGVLRLRGTYDRIIATVIDRPLKLVDPAVLDVLRLGVHQLLSMRVPDHAAVSATVGVAREQIGTGASGFVNAVLRKIAGRSLDSWLDEVAPAPTGDDPAADAALAARHSHPEWIVRALRQALLAAGRDAAELPDLLAADNAPAAGALLVRPGMVDDALPANLTRRGATPGRWSPHAWSWDAGSPGDLPELRTGGVRVADEGSQLVTLALLAAPLEPPATTGTGQRWLDLCAGPGGKSALLSALARPAGATGVSVELRPQRSAMVADAVAGAQAWWQVRTEDGREIGDAEPAGYDRVLADVPCTGLGALRRRPEARWRRSPADLTTLGPLQRELLTGALRACRPGGVVAYVTCSPHVAETRVVVEDVVKAGERGRSVPSEVLDARQFVTDRDGATLPDLGQGPYVQLWPHRHGTDAMFLALLRRR